MYQKRKQEKKKEGKNTRFAYSNLYYLLLIPFSVQQACSLYMLYYNNDIHPHHTSHKQIIVTCTARDANSPFEFGNRSFLTFHTRAKPTNVASPQTNLNCGCCPLSYEMINSWDVLETALALHLLLLSANTIYLVNKWLWSPHQTDSQAKINMHSCILSKPQEMDRQRGVTHLLTFQCKYTIGLAYFSITNHDLHI